MNDLEPSYNDLLSENQALAKEVALANDELIYLKNLLLRYLNEESERQKKITELEEENQKLKNKNGGLLSALTKIEEDMEARGIERMAKTWANARVRLSFDGLIGDNRALAKNVKELEQENQELKSQVEKYEMQNAGEDW